MHRRLFTGVFMDNCELQITRQLSKDKLVSISLVRFVDFFFALERLVLRRQAVRLKIEKRRNSGLLAHVLKNVPGKNTKQSPKVGTTRKKKAGEA